MGETETPTEDKDGRSTEEVLRGLWQRSLRDVVIVGTGAFILVNEGLNNLERPTLIAAAIACFGLPFAIRADERRK